MQILLLVLTITTVSACASGTYWQGSERTADETKRDYDSCLDALYREHPDWRQMNYLERGRIVDDCMRAKDYQRPS